MARGLLKSKIFDFGIFFMAFCCIANFILCIFASDMKEYIYNKRYKSFCKVLKKERKYHHLSQVILAKKLDIPQSFISKTEIGERRLDIIELLEYCDAMGLTLTDFVFRMEGRLLADGLLSPARKAEYQRWLSIYNEFHKTSSL